MAEFTKGPWEVVRAGVDEWVIYAPHERTIGRVYSLYSPETVEANARVMAAAPDMVEALENLLGLFVYNYERDTGRSAEQDIAEVRDAKAALAKAKGQDNERR